jgi:hypothetical protein
MTSGELVAGTLAEAAGAAALDEGLVGEAAQAPTEIATMAATLARTMTDEWCIELLLCKVGLVPISAGCVVLR